MYKNLVEILKRKGITNKAYADYLGITEKTVWNKLQGKTEFTLGEALKMDYVFEMEEKVA